MFSQDQLRPESILGVNIHPQQTLEQTRPTSTFRPQSCPECSFFFFARPGAVDLKHLDLEAAGGFSFSGSSSFSGTSSGVMSTISS